MYVNSSIIRAALRTESETSQSTTTSGRERAIVPVVAWIVLGEVPTIWQGLGAGSIMTGLVVTRT